VYGPDGQWFRDYSATKVNLSISKTSLIYKSAALLAG
jgi:hypothetical protein